IEHLAQFSGQFMGAYLHEFFCHTDPGYCSGDLYNEVYAALQAGQGPILSVSYGTKGHVLVAYDLEKGDGAGDFYIDVYDPNVPFLPAENDATTKGFDGRVLHTMRQQDSRIHVHADGTWSFPLLRGDGNSTGDWCGRLPNLAVIPYSQLPTHL